MVVVVVVAVVVLGGSVVVVVVVVKVFRLVRWWSGLRFVFCVVVVVVAVRSVVFVKVVPSTALRGAARYGTGRYTAEKKDTTRN